MEKKLIKAIKNGVINNGLTPGRALNTFKSFNRSSYITAWWVENDHEPNWGDSLNEYLIPKLSGKQLINIEKAFNVNFVPVHAVVGSIIERFVVYHLVIWGSGILRQDWKLRSKRIDVHAVRGPKTRERLLRDGIKCPEVYGDPALLLPMLHKPQSQKVYDLGVILHVRETDDPWLKNLELDQNTLIIDVCTETFEFIELVNSCKQVVSSSLHGLILADAYNIPNAWISLNDIHLGGYFKFEDYFLSVGREFEEPNEVRGINKSSQLLSLEFTEKIEFDAHALIDACPFISDRIEWL